MRAAKIIAAVAMAVALGSTPSSSWDVSPKSQESRSRHLAAQFVRRRRHSADLVGQVQPLK